MVTAFFCNVKNIAMKTQPSKEFGWCLLIETFWLFSMLKPKNCVVEFSFCSGPFTAVIHLLVDGKVYEK